MRKARVLALILPCIIAADASADANSLSDYLGPREISVGEAMRGDARGASSLLLNPAGLSTDRRVVFEGTGGFRDGDGAVPVSVAACDSTVPIAGCFYYRYFSASPEVGDNQMKRRVHEIGSSMSRAISPMIHLGVNTRYFDYNSDLMGEDDADGFAFDAGIMIRPSPSLGVGVTGHNLVVTEDTPQYPRAIGAGISAQPFSALTVGLDGVWNLETDEDTSTGRYGLGAQYLLSSGDRQSAYPLRVGGVKDVERDSTFFTAGLGFVSAKLGIDLGFRQQLAGGNERVFLAGVRVFGPTTR